MNDNKLTSQDIALINESTQMYMSLTPEQREELAQRLDNYNELHGASGVLSKDEYYHLQSVVKQSKYIQLNMLVASLVLQSRKTVDQGKKVYSIFYDAMKSMGVPVPEGAARKPPPTWITLERWISKNTDEWKDAKLIAYGGQPPAPDPENCKKGFCSIMGGRRRSKRTRRHRRSKKTRRH